MNTLQSFRIATIADRLGGDLDGEGDSVVTGAAPIESAGPEHITFLVPGPRAALLTRCRAGCVLVPRQLILAQRRTVIRVEDPRLAFSRVLAWLHPQQPAWTGVHATAIVHPRARLGANVTMGPYCVVGAGVAIGDDTVLQSNVAIHEGVTIGRRCLLHPGVVVGTDGFGFCPTGERYEKIPHVGCVEIGDDVESGANSTIDRGTMSATRIGDGTKIDNLVHVAHNCIIGRHVVIAAQTGIAGGATIGDWVIIGGQVGIGDHVRVDARAVIGAASAIPTGKRIHAGEPVWGVPARPLRQYLRRLASLARVEKLSDRLREAKSDARLP